MPAKKQSSQNNVSKSTKSSRSRNSTNHAKATRMEYNRQQAWAVIVFVIGLLLLTITLIKGKNVWLFLHNFLFGIFGIGTYLVAPLMIYIAVKLTIQPDIGKIKHKIWQIAVLLALACGMIQVIFMNGYSGNSLANIFGNLYRSGQELKSGGIISAVIGLPLSAAFGNIGAAIIMVLFIFAFILLITGTTLLDTFYGVRNVFRAASKPVKRMEDQYLKIREVREMQQEEEEDWEEEQNQVFLLEQPQEPYPRKKRFDFQGLFKSGQDLIREKPPEIPKEKEKPMTKAKTTAPKKSPVLLDIDVTDEDFQQEQKMAPLEELVKKAIPKSESNCIKKDQPDEPKEDELEETEDIVDELNEAELKLTKEYVYPPIHLLKAPVAISNQNLSEELKSNAELLVDTLKSFGVQTRIIDISRGPTVTRYELQPSAGVKISKITGLSDDIALNLAAAGVRIEAPIPNKAAVGIEVPNKVTETVTMREIVDSSAFRDAKSKLTVALGKDISGQEMVFDIAKTPHMLIAGSTGSGKSVCINSIIISLLYKATPEQVKLLMIDPKIVELGAYNGIPHLLVPVVTDPKKAAGALGWAVTEMLKRYQLFANNGVRDLSGFNALAEQKEELEPMPQIVIIIDELADLMMAAPNEVEDSICRLAQMARAAGMHMVIATQRPSVDVITGLIKANIPSRIAFAVSSQVDSRTILDQGGAEKLLGKGDMLFYPVGMAKPTRMQGCFVTDQERDQVIDFVKSDTISEYDDGIMDEIEKQAVQEKEKGNDGGGFDDQDKLMPQAIECVIEAGQASTSYLQRRLKVGYARAARLMDDMEAKGIIGPYEGSKPRKVLITRNEWIEMKMNSDDETAVVSE